jgi:hypothetical protein
LIATDIVRESGDRAELERLLAIVDHHRGSNPTIGLQAQRARLAGLLAADDGDDAAAEEHLRAAIGWAEQWHSVPTAARCRSDLAALLTRLGREEEAAPLAAQARSELDGLRAVRWAAQLDAALAGVPA